MTYLHRQTALALVATLSGVLFAATSGLAQTAAPAQTAPAAPQAPAQQAPAPQAAPSTQQAPPPATQSLTFDQRKKIDGWAVDKGKDIAVTPIITDILGLTKGDQPLICRAFAAEGEGDEIHQIYMLPDGKGYLEAHFYKDKLDVYWTDKNFVLLAAVEGVKGQKPITASFADAQYGFSFETAWWAKYADAH